MITFNLNQPNRGVLHKRIASGHITPRDLSTMSSTDLASEEAKQSIRQAEQEALAHSILKKTTLPTAKMTHKGIQDIEDVTGQGAAEREREREREKEEEERFERERIERLKSQAQKAQAQAQRASIPPDSPITPTSATWGAPPPVPMHALHQQQYPHDPGPSMMGSEGRPSLNPLFIHTSSDMLQHSPVETELNLSDFINMDEEPGTEGEGQSFLADPTIPPISESAPSSNRQGKEQAQAADGSSMNEKSPPAVNTASPVTALSPFAARSAHPDFTPRPSFDLNAIWSGSGSDDKAQDTDQLPAKVQVDDQSKGHDSLMQDENGDTIESPSQRSPDGMHDDPGVVAQIMASDIITEEADDRDFDMFLEDEATEQAVEKPTSPEAIAAAFEDAAKVWTGKVCS